MQRKEQAHAEPLKPTKLSDSSTLTGTAEEIEKYMTAEQIPRFREYIKKVNENAAQHEAEEA